MDRPDDADHVLLKPNVEWLQETIRSGEWTYQKVSKASGDKEKNGRVRPGVSVSMLRQVYRGRTTTKATFKAIARAYGVPLWQVIDASDWPKLDDEAPPGFATGLQTPLPSTDVNADDTLATRRGDDSRVDTTHTIQRASRRLATTVCSVLIGLFLAGSAAWFGWYSLSKSRSPDEVHYEKGIYHYDQKQWAEAIGAFTRAIDADPRNADAYHMKGLCYAHWGGKFAEALPCYDEALRLNPHLYGAYTNRGWARRELKDFDGALKDFDEVIDRLKPPDHELADAYRNRATVHRYKCGDDRACLARAIPDYQQAIRLKPSDSFAAKRGLTEVYERLGRHDEADALRKELAP